MKPGPLPLLSILVLVLVLGGAIWLRWGRDGGRTPAPRSNPANGPADPAPAPSAAPANPTAAKPAPTRTEIPGAQAPVEAPPAGAPEPAQPLPGAGVRAIYGGADAFVDFYKGIDTDGRRSRLQELDAALAEYNGDPPERSEFDKYEALKEELLWLQAHPDP